jgi:hypothetical protein
MPLGPIEEGYRMWHPVAAWRLGVVRGEVLRDLI